MQYRVDPKSGNELSILGFGCMRFARSLTGGIDLAKAEPLLVEAIAQGVNYLDTAYIYGGSEEAVGTILDGNNLREQIYLATKLPHGQVKSLEDADRIFAEQLTRLKIDYIDYYLLHNISTLEHWTALQDLGIEQWAAAQKAAGKIKQFGFSFHGTQDNFMELLDAYDWDFVQIQYNYMNENYQAGTKGLKAAHAKGLPVIVMEPLLGGKLATGLPKAAQAVFDEVEPKQSPANWALRWLYNQPEVTVVLSGMNSAEQLADNLATAAGATVGALTGAEEQLFTTVQEAFKRSYKVPCTGCNYCMPCPNGVNIPGCFAAYNMRFAIGFVGGITQYITSTAANSAPGKHTAAACIDCGACESKCPQHIAIMSELKNVKKTMEPFWFTPIFKIISKFL
jgi:predicted aldo/keto reductase-like oxidoreductase